MIQTQKVNLPSLDQETIVHLRAPFDQEGLARMRRELAGDSDDEEEAEIPETFPDSQGQSSSYF